MRRGRGTVRRVLVGLRAELARSAGLAVGVEPPPVASPLAGEAVDPNAAVRRDPSHREEPLSSRAWLSTTTRSTRSMATPSSLKAYEGKALLLVNVASKCGLTPQYTGLEELQKKYESQGLHGARLPVQPVRRAGARLRRGDLHVLLDELRRDVPPVREDRGERRGPPPDLRRARGGRRPGGPQAATSSGTSRSSSSARRARSSRGSARSSRPRTPRSSRRSNGRCRADVAAYRAAVFDMDGLLVDSEVLWHQAELEILVPLGRGDRRARRRGRPRGCSSPRSSSTTSGSRGWSTPSVDEVVAQVLARVGDLVEERGRLLPGALDALSALRRRSGPIALASSTPTALIRRTLAHFGIADALRGRPLRRGRADGQAPSRGLPHRRGAPRRRARAAAWPSRTRPPACARPWRRSMDCVAVPVREERADAAFSLATVVLDSLADLDDEWLATSYAASGAGARRAPGDAGGSVARRRRGGPWPRPPTPRDPRCSRSRTGYVEELAARDPLLATDRSASRATTTCSRRSRPQRWQEDADVHRGVARDAPRASSRVDDVDRIAKAVMDERLSDAAELERSGEYARRFGTIVSPVSSIRQVFELMRRETPEDRRRDRRAAASGAPRARELARGARRRRRARRAAPPPPRARRRRAGRDLRATARSRPSPTGLQSRRCPTT